MSVHGKANRGKVAAELRRRILEGEYAVNDRLPSERNLAAMFGVARGTARQALELLVEDGLIVIRAGSGAYVAQKPSGGPASAIAQAGPLELIDARFALEPHICRLAVLHGKHVQFDRLETLCQSMEHALETADRTAFARADAAFHAGLAACTGNGLLIWMIGQINMVRTQDDWTTMQLLTLNRATIEQYNKQHRAILDALRARSPEPAATTMKKHLETARFSLTRALDT